MRTGILVAVMLLAAGAANADVFNMGSGLTSLETVTVGDPGNAPDTTGYGAVSYTYNIGKFEVTAGQYTAFLNAVAKTDTYGLYYPSMFSKKYGCKIQRTGSPGSYAYSVASDYANRPVNYVTWGDCARFANWLDNGQPTGAQDLSTTEDGAYYLNGATSDGALITVARKAGAMWVIPTEDEWYKAAYYNPATSSYYAYSSSTNTVPGRDMTDASGNNANYGDPQPIDSGKYYTTVVGQFQNSASPYGTFDQGGNVEEWNEATIDATFRGLRGGAYGDGSYDLSAMYRDYYYSTWESYGFGFRVAEVPEPASIVFLTLGGLAILKRRRGLGR